MQFFYLKEIGHTLFNIGGMEKVLFIKINKKKNKSNKIFI
jgi:hypothetical protein